MANLGNRTALVTGASQGIGRAVALALAGAGARVHMTARSAARLEETRRSIESAGGESIAHELDLADPGSIDALAGVLQGAAPSLDLLVNNAGVYAKGEDAVTLERIWRTNVAGTCALTRALLSCLVETAGDLVFVNSSIVRSAGPDAGSFAIGQHALGAFADVVRAEVNEQGVRVLSIFAGRTATPRQKAIFESEGRAFDAVRLLQADDIASLVVTAVGLPATAEVTDLHVRPRFKW